jgi:uncharacterized RDD family membrane protein YckC
MPPGYPMPPRSPVPPPGYPGAGPMPYGIQPPPYASGPPPGYFLPPPVPVSPAGVPLADFGTRLGAYVIDALLLGAINLAVALPAFFLLASQIFAAAPTTDPDNDPGWFFATTFLPLIGFEAGVIVFGLAISYLYSVEVMHRSGQTLGKRILKIQVIPLDPNLRLTRTMAVKRWATEFLPGAFVAIYALLDGLWQLWDRPFQQTLHDKAAQTIVVKVSA